MFHKWWHTMAASHGFFRVTYHIILLPIVGISDECHNSRGKGGFTAVWIGSWYDWTCLHLISELARKMCAALSLPTIQTRSKAEQTTQWDNHWSHGYMLCSYTMYAHTYITHLRRYGVCPAFVSCQSHPSWCAWYDHWGVRQKPWHRQIEIDLGSALIKQLDQVTSNAAFVVFGFGASDLSESLWFLEISADQAEFQNVVQRPLHRWQPLSWSPRFSRSTLWLFRGS